MHRGGRHVSPYAMSKLIELNPWQQLRQFTQARIALGRTGASLPTQALLDFGLAHAQARDAVHTEFDRDELLEQLHADHWPTLAVHSAASDRHHYLRRPDLGRSLNDDSRAQLQALQLSNKPEVIFIVADGLSSVAPLRHAVPLLQALKAGLQDWHVGPVVVAEQARVALGDEVGELLGAQMVVMLIGERPGLSSPDSLGIYLTYAPRVGLTDADRNCISNVRLEGLSYPAAAHKLLYLMNGARRMQLSGVALKDDSDLVMVSNNDETLIDKRRS
jgi:ethanolamine ammonia-lyase small subunit